MGRTRTYSNEEKIYAINEFLNGNISMTAIL